MENTINFEYKIEIKKRKSISISIDKNGSVIVRAPKYISKKYIENFVISKSTWIKKNLQKIKEEKNITEKKFYSGEEFQYLGSKIQLIVSNENFNNIKFDGKNFIISKDNLNSAKKLFYKFYFEKAQDIIINRTNFYVKKYNFIVNNIKISNANTRWGSCSIKRNINLNWKLIMSDIKIIDYVIIHELAHTIEHNHSKNFWKIVENIIPDYKEKRLWLKKSGGILDLK